MSFIPSMWQVQFVYGRAPESVSDLRGYSIYIIEVNTITIWFEV